jgi:voltage-gated potassium channel
MKASKPRQHWRQTLHTIIYEADTPAGKIFDIMVLLCICLSVIIVLLDSVHDIHAAYRRELLTLEWFFTLVFTIEYILRIISVRKPIRYMTSFFGIVDLMSVLPTYLSFFIPGTQYLLVIRILRMLRIFRIFKLVEYVGSAGILRRALWASRHKISVFLFTVLTIAVIIGSLMYVIEGEEHGFNNIPISIYWAIVTLTTVGYGDLSPQTPLGQMLSMLVMVLGYGIIAVPTGIVTLELGKIPNTPITTQACPNCAAEGHDHDAIYCKYCGHLLN